LNTSVALALGAWLLLQLGISVWASRRVATEGDFLVAGRSLGLPLVTLSLFATWFGAETMMGSSAMVAEQGLSGARADPFGYALTLLLMGVLLAFKMRERGYLTIGDFLAARFGRRIEWLGSLILIPSVVTWAGAQLLAFGNILEAMIGIDLTLGITLAAIFVVIYTSVGGLLGDIWTDAIQGSVVIIGIVILFVTVVQLAGGLGALYTNIAPEQLRLVPSGESSFARLELWAIPIVGSLVSQVALARILAARTPRVARQACFLASVFYLTIGVLPVTIALAAPQLGVTSGSGDNFLPLLAAQLLTPWLSMIFMGALVSAILSTIDSGLLTVSALLSHNILVPAFGEFAEKKRLLLNRAMVVVAGVAAWLIAILGERILELVIFADSIGTAGLVVIVVVGLYTKIGGPTTALITLAVGMFGPFVGGELLGFDAPWLATLIVCLALYVGCGWRLKN
jgi:SSS family transporter